MSKHEKIEGIAIIVLFCLIAFASVNAQEVNIIDVDGPAFIHWEPQVDAVQYRFQLLRQNSNETGDWILDTTQACQARLIATGEPWCGVYIDMTPGLYSFFVSWQLPDDTWLEGRGSESEGWIIRRLNNDCTPMPPTDLIAAVPCRTTEIMFVLGDADES